MSVYTSITSEELADFLTHYDIGSLVDYQGIESGIENTNYFVTTDRGRYVLTIFEQHSAEELRFFLDLTAFLAEQDVRSAHPRPARHGDYLTTLKDKPAAIVDRLAGASVEQPNTAQCAAVGSELARLHLAGQEFPHQRANGRGPAWWRETRDAVHDKLTPEDQALLDAEIAFQTGARALALPRGIIHADLFRDNVLFEGERLSGLIDFYYACTDALLYDLAVTVNDWATDGTGALDPVRAQALLAAYCAVRPINGDERHAWPVMLRAAALRFWLSRLYDMHFPRPGEMTHTKDPEVFRRILSARIDAGDGVQAHWPEH